MIENYAVVDTETTGLSAFHGARMFAASAVLKDGTELFWRGEYQGLKRICEDPTIDKVFHNAKFDLKMLNQQGIEVVGKVWDTMILGHLIDGRDARGGLSLDSMSRKYVPQVERKLVDEIEKWFADNGLRLKGDKDYSKLPHDLLRKRALGDVRLTKALFERLLPVCSKYFGKLLEQEHRLLHVVDKLERRGMLIDLQEVERQAQVFTEIAEDVQDFFIYMWGNESFNINSREHQRELLGRLGLMKELEELAGDDPARRTESTNEPKLDDYNLRRLQHPVPHMLLVGKAAMKMRDTFLSQLESLSVGSVLHPNLNQLGTVTGRFACSNPNLQNIPIEGDRRTAYTEEEAQMSYEMTGHVYAPHIKRNFICRKGYAHVHSDKIQAEMVAVAHYAKSRTMIEIFDSGISIHEGLCWKLYNQYTKGLKTRTKAVVFGFCYGAGDRTLAMKIGGSIGEARATRARLEQFLPDLPRWRDELKSQIARVGYIETLHGRRHYLTNQENYKAVNRACQSSVADEIKSCMVRLDDMYRSEGYDARVLLNIHDDLVNEVAEDQVPEVVPKIYEIMNSSLYSWNCKPRADMNITYSSWSDLQEIDHPDCPETYSRSAFFEKLEHKAGRH